jgi:chemotaxis family two-component system response regulator Rcp1
MPSRPIEILLVEDSPGDIWLTRDILLKGSVPKNISVVTDGEQALDYLFARGRYSNVRRPDLVLLDLNLPRRNGLEVLSVIKNDPDLRIITVIVLTTSGAASDVNSAYQANANCYIVKPVELEAFTSAIESIEQFWLSMALLPSTLPPSKPDLKADATASSSSPVEGNGSGPTISNFTRLRRLRCRTIGYPERHAPSFVSGCNTLPECSTGGPISARSRSRSGDSRYRHRR